MKTREELLNEVNKAKKAKKGAIVAAIISVALYFFFAHQQRVAEQELLILDQGRLDEMVLGE